MAALSLAFLHVLDCSSALAFVFRHRYAKLTPFPPVLCLLMLSAEAKRQLLDAGFTLLSENDDWDLQPGGRYFFMRNMSCLIAFAVGEK